MRERLPPDATDSGWLAPHPAKRAVERYWLWYTLAWGGITAVFMIGGLLEHAGDAACLAFGLALGAGAVVGPLRVRVPEERDLPLHERTGFKLTASVVALAFLLNYSQTPFFFDVLHMHFGFHVRLAIRHNPLFLYFLTVAYFATYAALCLVAWRALRRWAAGRSRLLAVAAWLLAPLTMALLETLLNANPFTRRLFCYDDPRFMLWFGTLAYGLSFVLVLPLWAALDETPARRLPLAHVLVYVCAAVYVDSLALDLLRYHVAPRFTTVVQDADGLGDVGPSCLRR